MTPEKSHSSKTILLCVFVMLCGVAAISIAVARQAVIAEHGWMMMIAALLLLAPLGEVSVPGIKGRLVVGDVVTFACAALVGPNAAVIAAAVDGAATSLKITKSPLKFFYNVATCVLSMTAAGMAAKAVFPRFGSAVDRLPVGELIVAMGIFALCYFLVSTVLISSFLAVTKGTPLWPLWRDYFSWSSIGYLVNVGFSVAAYELVGQFGYYIFFVAVGAMLFISLFYRTYFHKVETANHRAQSMEELNHHTMEAMVAAIGAIGYGVKMNLRRVQHLALALGEASGCSADEMKALRVAALFHDIGNTASPQHLLEKSTMLNAEELEKVKLNAGTGARLAEVIGFPFPVADIIKHHHERFDGTGYPNSLKGEEIPLAARVLAIVECYNALTTDQPLRSRLGTSDALKIMKDNSSTAFDPMLVSKFLDLVATADVEARQAQSSAVEIDEMQAEFLHYRQGWQAA
jgi:putative nucleotidyltransferase with HDIG domain